MALSLLSAVFLVTAAASPAGAEKAAASVFESRADLTPQGEIDKRVFAQLERLGIPPANLSSDGVFVRRAYLDTIGTLPTAEEAREFLAQSRRQQAAALIDRLLERDEFADYWAMKWSDLLRIKAEFPINLWPNAAQAYHRWVRTSLKENQPYDQFVRELLTASGSNFRVPPVNFYRALQSREPQAIAQAVALTFMGTRAEKWPKERWPACRPSSPRSATRARTSGKRRSSSSTPASRARRRRASFPTAPGCSFPRTAIRARSLPIG